MIYILKEDKPFQIDDIETWIKWMSNISNRRVAFDIISISPNIAVSTCFTGFPYEYKNGFPLLFENLVIGGKWDGSINRYALMIEAKTAHSLLVSELLQQVDSEQ